ncbi:hypothetical protein [Kitasatospora sp. NPDC058218]|uniref:hypothetical protein n=1 Tax=Kitasatospora sp. NPDC058218 TaxID=3346385 RepID=UPI0036D849CC
MSESPVEDRPVEEPQAEGPPLVPDLEADPLEGVPEALLDLVGSYDHDTAGGCG